LILFLWARAHGKRIKLFLAAPKRIADFASNALIMRVAGANLRYLSRAQRDPTGEIKPTLTGVIHLF
jgi:hypothetical protein